MGATGAFLIFYRENYQDGIADKDEVYKYTDFQYAVMFDEFQDSNLVIEELEPGSNYVVVYWNENEV
jgi:hypothetical protein